MFVNPTPRQPWISALFSAHLNLSISPPDSACAAEFARLGYVSLRFPLYFPLDGKTNTHKEEFKQEFKMKIITFYCLKLKYGSIHKCGEKLFQSYVSIFLLF